MTVTDYPYIPKQPSNRAVLRRMGYNKKVMIDQPDMDTVERLITHAADICRPSGRAVVIPIAEKTVNTVTLQTGNVFESAGLVKMLGESKEILLMGTTLGKAVVDRINHELKDGDMVFAVVLDAYASECVDDALDFIMQRQGKPDFRAGNVVTKHRYSAGYGDLNIEYQKQFYDILKMNEIGVSINESDMLSPEKSVIAIAGVLKP